MEVLDMEIVQQYNIQELEEEILPEFEPQARHTNWLSQITAGVPSHGYIGR